MRKLMLRSQSGRRRPRYGPQLCAASAALLLLLISLSVLHSRLSSSPFRLVLPLLPHPHNSSSSSDPPPSDARMIDQLDRLADEDDDDDEILESDQPEDLSGLFWDHAAAVARRSFARILPSDPNNRNRLLPPPLDAAEIKTAFGSDDQPVDEGVRIKLDSIRHIEDALMLKTAGNSPLRDGWARWLEGKADFLRRDRMLRSNLELLIPKNHPLLQDPDMPGVTTLTRGDRLMQSAIWKELDNTPFPAAAGATVGEVKRVELRKPLNLHADGRRWGYFPGLDPHLSFSEFMDRFLGGGRCSINVFMVWNSPSWMYGVRHQRGLESLLYRHKDACVVVFSETMELDFFQDFVNDGYYYY